MKTKHSKTPWTEKQFDLFDHLMKKYSAKDSAKVVNMLNIFDEMKEMIENLIETVDFLNREVGKAYGFKTYTELLAEYVEAKQLLEKLEKENN